MKVIQCVCINFPDLCPNKGGSSVNFRISFTFTLDSFHLKIRVPLGFSNLKHSLKPKRSIPFQSPERFPYCLAIIPLVFSLTMCGGSITTKWNELSGNGSAVKSAIISGSMFAVLVPDGCVIFQYSFLLSTYNTLLSCLLNHIPFGPQQTSNTSFFKKHPTNFLKKKPG